MEGKGTGAGKFSTVNKFNELGLIETSKITYPQDGRPKETKVKYLYNKFGQLLRIVENNETEVENIYDAVGNLLETKTSVKDFKYYYNDENKITKEEINENGVQSVLNYSYSSSGLLEKKIVIIKT